MIDQRLDMMTYDELNEYASWILKELQRYANEYNHGSEPLWELIAEVSAELKKRSEGGLDKPEDDVVDSSHEESKDQKENQEVEAQVEEVSSNKQEEE